MATIKSFTSLEQSKKLLELGLRPETADMYWDYDENTQSLSEAMAIPIYEGSWELHHKNWSKDIPCWSLAALRKLLPVGIKNEKGDTYLFHCNNRWDGTWVYMYAMEEITYAYFTGSDINACYNMICWLLENNYIKKGE